MSIVVPSDPPWPQRFQAASAELLAATGHLFLRLEHIGSTSVPGLAAKPTREVTWSALACTQRYGQNLWPPASARPCPDRVPGRRLGQAAERPARGGPPAASELPAEFHAAALT
jgi:GrpB protein